MTARFAPITRIAVTVALFVGFALAASSAEVVILKDGFVIQGNVHKETETIYDKGSGRSVPIVKTTGFDMIDEGPKVTIFSTHAKQLGAIAPDTKIRPAMKGYTRLLPGGTGAHPLPSGGTTTKISEFDDKWVRVHTVAVPVPNAKPEQIKQQIYYIDPYYIYLASNTHRWRATYRTNEWDPKLVRKLLMTHPDLAEPDGKCDPIKRIALAKFLLDAGWLQLAKDEMDRLKRDFVGTMSKDAKEQHENLLKEIDQATADLVVREAELALAAGRYKYAAELLAVFPERTAHTKEVARAAKVSADLKTSQERYDNARRLLRALIDEVSGRRPINALVGASGGLAAVCWQPPKTTSGKTLALASAAEEIYGELHPDSAIRIETFVTLATQAEAKRRAKQEPAKKPEELLATAVSGWVEGKNGATPIPDDALKLWTARELVLAYQRAENRNDRTAVLTQFKKTISIPVDELAQIISLLPPAEPEDLNNRTGKPVALRGDANAGVYRRTTRAVEGHPTGLDYLVKLPPEYHHGRAYPVLIVLSHGGINPEDILAPLVAQADKNGYILVVPEWTDTFGKGGWEWQGEDHIWVTAALRDAVRHFTIDNDKVFMIGVGDGANMAMDVGMSHPDLFAGVIPMGPMPKWQGLFIEYWRNAQKLPFFIVTGEMIGDGVKSIRSIYEKWMPYGYPALWTIYKGRGIEWYSSEVPVLFDWMSRKTRANGTSTLALGNSPAARQPWQMIRKTDNHFYWLQADDISPGKNGGQIVPAWLQGDIRGNNVIDIRHHLVNELTIWLSSDMIPNWNEPVRVQINGTVPNGYPRVGKVIKPDLEVLLEDYYKRGDRRMLFLNKLEFSTNPPSVR